MTTGKTILKEESESLSKDINKLYQQILLANPDKEKVAVITAGAPGAGKTVKLRQDLEDHALQGKHFAYICPDDVCLQNQVRTYKTDLEKSDNFIEAHQRAYNKGLLLPQRISDTLLKYADEIEFNYRDGVQKDATLAARWLRNEEGVDTLQIVAPEQYERVKAIHNETAKKLARPDFYWGSTVEKSSP